MLSKQELGRVLLIFFYVLLYLVIVVAIIESSKFLLFRSDFKSFLTGAAILKNGLGESLYDMELQRTVQSELLAVGGTIKLVLPYLYPPFVTAIYYPLTLVDAESAFRIYSVFYTAILFTLPFVINRILFKNKPRLFPFLVVVFPLSIHSLVLGQNSLLVLLIYVAILGSVLRLKYSWAGILSGLLMIKPQHLIFVPFVLILLRMRDKKISARKLKTYCIYFSLVITAFLLFSFLVSGLGTFKYLNALNLADTSYYAYTYHIGFTLRSFVATQFTDLSFLAEFIINAVAYVILLSLFYFRSRKISFGVGASAAIIFTILTSVYTTELLLLFVPMIYLFEESKNRHLVRKTILYILIVALFFVSIRLWFFPIPLHPSLLLACSGVVLLFLDKVEDLILVFTSKD
ncbi:glycosyltransferase family 87 protein [Patescibacteria group bacterium]